MNIDFLKKYSIGSYRMAKKIDFENIEDGKIMLTDNIYVNVETYNTKNRKSTKFESHKKYIDVQYVIRGRELISIAHVKECIACTDYDADRDIIFYEDNYMGIYVTLYEGEHLVIYTQDAHMPCLNIEGYDTVKKAVFKIPIDLVGDGND